MNFKESKAIYLQIADRICDEVLLGQYREEERIPSVREYAAVVEVNANTVMRSYDYLQSQEVIYNKRGIPPRCGIFCFYTLLFLYAGVLPKVYLRCFRKLQENFGFFSFVHRILLLEVLRCFLYTFELC